MIKRFTLAMALMIGAIVSTGSDAQAQGPAPFGFGFQPFGFYQPYGATFGNQLRTPPYFSLNPPVYYGARYARPYGASPFAAPPMVGAAQGYRPRLRSQFSRPPASGPVMMRRENPFIHISRVLPPPSASDQQVVQGEVKLNPYVSGTALVSK
ncbi:MAG: hypothetical protein AAF958_07630 [Planctomycetota bacterium]